MTHYPVEAPQRPVEPIEAGRRLYESAREWQRLQLAVLGFAGLCGVLGGDSGSSRPLWLQDISGIAAVVGLALALLALTTVATVAFPITRRPITTATSAKRLKAGIAITYIAAALTAVSGLSLWWPSGRDAAETAHEPVSITTLSGSACGTVEESDEGSLELETHGKRVKIPLSRLLSMKPVDDC
jgi:hypothetical protein